jgi:hypothetical protein
MPHPETGIKQGWTRPSTLAKTLSDTYHLQRWGERMAVKGIANRTDLYALAAATPLDDKDTLNRVAKEAKDAATAGAGANFGTATHSFTESYDRGEQPTPPEPWNRDLDAYAGMLRDHGLGVYPHWIERMVCTPAAGTVGTFDRIYRYQDKLVIGDIKTAKQIEFGWLDISIQLAIYANATHIWEPELNAWDPMPELDKKKALVVHILVGTRKCELWEIDIESGWEATQIALDVRAWRSRKDLAARCRPERVADVVDVERNPVLEKLERATHVENVANQISEAKTVDQLTQIWKTATDSGVWEARHTDLAKKKREKLEKK